MTSMMFASDAHKATMVTWHHRFGDLAAARGAVSEPIDLDTSFGRTHVLVSGPKDGPPLVLLHGALASSSHVLAELAALTTTFRIYAVDVIGQSVMSEDTRIAVNDDSYGRWLVEVMDALALPKAHVVGVSWGGFCALRLTALAPTRVERLALLMPAGVVTGSAWQGITKMMWPMMRYVKNPTEQRLAAFSKNLLTTVDDDNWRACLGDAFVAARMNMKVPKLASVGEFAGFTGPVFVVGADHDVSFPGDKLIARIRLLFAGPVDAELLKDTNHSPPTTDAFRAFMAGRMHAFFSGDAERTAAAA